MDLELGACLFHKRQWELGEPQWSGWLWCCERSCWWCSWRMTKQSSPAASGWGRRGASETRIQSRSTPSEAKPGSLWTCGLALSPAATPRVCHWPSDCTRGSPHSLAHQSTLWCWLSSQLWKCEVAWCGPHLKPHQRPLARPCYLWQSSDGSGCCAPAPGRSSFHLKRTRACLVSWDASVCWATWRTWLAWSSLFSQSRSGLSGACQILLHTCIHSCV